MKQLLKLTTVMLAVLLSFGTITQVSADKMKAVSYTHLRAHET